MAANLKGNLGLKSGPLAPTSAKLTTQYLVLDHMNNHFNKIAKAKSAIDSRPPKSLTSSQKMRDRKNRSRLLSSPRTRPTSAMMYTDMQHYEDVLNDEPEDEEERLVHSIMKSTLVDKPKGSNNATYGSESATDFQEQTTYASHNGRGLMTHPQYTHTLGASTRPMSARSARSVGSATSSMRVPVGTHDQTRITYNGDILEKRAHKFTEPDRPFTPRTNISNHESRLKSSKCYNPPKPKPAGKKVNGADGVKERSRGPAKNEAGMGRSNQELRDTMETSQLSESMLMDITLRSRDDRHEQASDGQVPRLDISMDKDHLNWLQEQASKAKVRARSGAQIPQSHLVGDISTIKEEPSDRSGSNSVRKETLKKTISHNREEEQKYLAFAKEVTDDVLTRGISTDRVLNRVFENHIARRKHDLDETRMRSVIRDLKKDLGLRDGSQERRLDETLADINYNNKARSMNGLSHTSSSDHQPGSEKSTMKDETRSFSQTNGYTMTSLEPLNNNTTSEAEMSTTLDSTSTMKFGRTADVFSTINSEATLEEREAREGDELSATQALKQYQFNLTVKEAGADCSESAVESATNGRETDVSEKSQKLERPATGERRLSEGEESPSDASSFTPSPADHAHRARRRERMKKSKGTAELGEQPMSSNSRSSSGTVSNNVRTTTDDVYSSEMSGQTSGLSGTHTTLTTTSDHNGSTLTHSEEVNGISGGSGGSLRPTARRRGGSRSQVIAEDPESSSGMGEEERGKDSLSRDNRATDMFDQGSSVGGEASGADDTETRGKSENGAVERHDGSSTREEKEKEEEEDYDYEDDYDADEDDGQGVSTHRTSDDDF
ncbi:spermatogenesis-associated protein 7 isoform X2 [Aplysia californica]|uniref:Spermatogenesis-associated protein 7 isoform X2 n=1 Tax=Aplysia californica TaxID=6500 RepID=A0ABM0K175_APLCA|nr:spermatogenesis-associated protein 7 isoform X2 [Aplysia californica]